MEGRRELTAYVGAAYLIYLGATRLLAKHVPASMRDHGTDLSHVRRFSEGVYVTLLNPKAFLLYASLFPQFVDPSREHVDQLALLALTFSGLMVGIHSIYAAVASAAKQRVLSERWSNVLNRATGGLFVGLGVGIAVSTR